MSICKLNYNRAEVLFREHGSCQVNNLHVEEQIIWHDPKQHEEFIHAEALTDTLSDFRLSVQRVKGDELNSVTKDYVGLVGAKRILFFSLNKFIGSKLSV